VKKLLVFVVLGLLLSFNVNAIDIRDFQIEGISLGDSALDFFEKKELKKLTRTNKSKVYDKYCSQKFTTYENGICFYTKKNDKLYIIESIAGFENFPNNIAACYNEQNNVDKEIRKLFPNTKRVVYDEYKNPIDRSGQSTERDIVYLFNDGSEAGTACLKWGKKWLKKNPKSSTHLQVFLDTKEYAKWLKDGMK
jgi:hypothetical protein